MERCGPGADDTSSGRRWGRAQGGGGQGADAAKPGRETQSFDEPKGGTAGDGGFEKGEEKAGRRLGRRGSCHRRGQGAHRLAHQAGLGRGTPSFRAGVHPRRARLADDAEPRGYRDGPVDVREAIWGAIETMRTREKDDGGRGREPTRTPKSAKRPRTN